MEVIHTIGRRKTSVARIFLSEGNGSMTVNKKEYKDFKTFVRKLNEPTFDEKNLSISWKHKKRFELSWSGPFHVDGKSEQLVAGLPEVPPRLDNPAVTLKADGDILDATFGKEKLKIDVIKGKRIEPKSQV